MSSGFLIKQLFNDKLLKVPINCIQYSKLIVSDNKKQKQYHYVIGKNLECLARIDLTGNINLLCWVMAFNKIRYQDQLTSDKTQ